MYSSRSRIAVGAYVSKSGKRSKAKSSFGNLFCEKICAESTSLYMAASSERRSAASKSLATI